VAISRTSGVQLRRTWQHIALTAALVALGGCAAPHAPAVPSRVLPDRVQVRTGGRVVSVPIEEYVLGSVLAEVSPGDQPAATAARIFEVQAILARTYAAAEIGRHHAEGFDLCDTTHCQVYDPARIKTSRFAEAARAAVQRTAGRIVTYGQRPVEALYHADCGGYTTTAEAVWGGRGLPYLLPEPDKLPTDPHHKWRLSVPADRLRAALNVNAASEVGRRLDNLKVISRDVSGRVASIAITGEHPRTIRGEQLRTILDATLGNSAIQSTKLTVTRPNATTYLFEGTGFGHGVGLCQVGAAARARRGDSLDAIVEHYFPGAAVTSAGRR
jgi:stage II sporulation protein D